jgi:hypothetical protein
MNQRPSSPLRQKNVAADFSRRPQRISGSAVPVRLKPAAPETINYFLVAGFSLQQYFQAIDSNTLPSKRMLHWSQLYPDLIFNKSIFGGEIINSEPRPVSGSVPQSVHPQPAPTYFSLSAQPSLLRENPPGFAIRPFHYILLQIQCLRSIGNRLEKLETTDRLSGGALTKWRPPRHTGMI